MNAFRILVVVILVCASMLQNAAWAEEYADYAARLRRAVVAGQITNLQRAKLLRKANQEVFGRHNAERSELWDYIEFIESKHDQGMSDEEARYLIQRAQNELNARVEAKERADLEALREERWRQEQRERAHRDELRLNTPPKVNSGDFIFYPRPSN